MSAILKQKLIDIANGFTKYGLWKGGGSGNLSELDDVTLTNLQSNDVLTYNGSEWVNDDNLQTQINILNSNLVEIMSVERYYLNLRTIPTNTEVIMHTITPEKDIFINIKASIIFRDDSNIGIRDVAVKINNVIYDEQQQGKTTAWTIINNVSYLGLLKAGSTLSIVVYQNSGENVDVDGIISVNN